MPPSRSTKGGSSTNASSNFSETCLCTSIDLTKRFISFDFSGSSLRNCFKSFNVLRLVFRLSKSLGEIDP